MTHWVVLREIFSKYSISRDFFFVCVFYFHFLALKEGPLLCFKLWFERIKKSIFSKNSSLLLLWYSFDPCSPEIDRSLLCEALNIRMNKRTRRIIDEPCQNQGTGYAHFKCTTEDAVILHLKTRHMENEASLEIRGHVYKVFTVPTNIQPLLVNPFYERYNSLDKWIRERKPTSGEISSRMEETE